MQGPYLQLRGAMRWDGTSAIQASHTGAPSMPLLQWHVAYQIVAPIWSHQLLETSGVLSREQQAELFSPDNLLPAGREAGLLRQPRRCAAAGDHGDHPGQVQSLPAGL